MKINQKEYTDVHTNVGDLTYSTIEPNAGLKIAVNQTQEEIIKIISDSGLRGLGGAGVPVGFKWNLTRKDEDSPKYVVCNADEGEPGTFKDRVILTEYADLVFEGMTIAGLAVGAEYGILYLRGEYEYLKEHLEAVLDCRRGNKILGENIFNQEGKNFDIRIYLGASAYVCGEKTGLIESLEGKRGEPRNRAPFAVNQGYLDKPTIVNNVETLAWATCIMTKGAEWFRSHGTEKSPGLNILSVSGDCKNPGVYEFSMKSTVNDIIKIAGAENVRAVQIGGASGRCVGRSQFEHSIAFEDIPTSGAVTIFNETRDMLAVAENYMKFFVHESCGQCTPCRIGNTKLLDGIQQVRAGTCSDKYLKDLFGLCETMKMTSKCGFGQTSPNAFLSILHNLEELQA